MRKALYILLLFGAAHAIGQQPEPTTITLAWDTSASMADNEPVYAFRYLETVFAAKPNARVRLVEFNTGIKESEYRVLGGNWSALKEHLQNLNYDGIALYGILSDYLTTGPTYMYTDGEMLLEGDKLAVEAGNIILSRATGEAQRWLERAALIYRGEYVQLKPNETKAKEIAGNSIQGKVYIDGKPARGVEIRRMGVAEAFRTGPEGKFSLESNPNDTLLLSGPGLEPRMVVVRSESEYNFYLNSKGIALDEVTVTAERAEEPEMVQTAIVPRDKRRIGYASQTIGDEDITEIQTDIAQTLQGRFSGVTIKSGQDATQFKSRTDNSMLLNNYGLIVIDGVPMGRSDSGGDPNNQFSLFDSSYLDPENIASMTILKGFVATNKYGTLGSGGVIEIVTKNAVYAKSGGKPEDALKVKGNVYEDGSDPELTTTSALAGLLKAVPVSKRIDRYFELREGNENRLSFFLEAYDFFKKDKPIDALRILSNVVRLAPEDPEAYLILSMGIQELLYAGGSRPGYGGTRLQKSMEGVSPAGQILSATLEKVDPQGYQGKIHQAFLKSNARLFQENIKTLTGDYRSLKSAAGLTREFATDLGKSITYLAAVRNRDLGNENPALGILASYPARIVFEWSRPGAQFVLQSVNPQKRYYNWDHTELGEASRLREEMQTGISLRSFDLAGAGSSGEWIFNIENSEDPSLSDTPLVVGCRVYYNYGTPSVRMEYHTTTLRPGEKKQLLRLLVN